MKIAPCKRWFLWSLIFMLLLTGIPVWAGEEGVVKGSVVNIRKGPGTSYAVMTQVRAGQAMAILDKSGSWLKVRLHNGQAGWVHKDHIEIRESSVKTITVKSSTLNVRKGPGTGFAKIGQVRYGTKLAVIEERNDWYLVQVPGLGQGWVAGWLVASPAPAVPAAPEPSRSISGSVKYLTVTGSTVNVRKGPGTNFEIVAKIRINERYAVLAEQNGWYKIQAGSQQGWITGEYAKLSEVPEIPPEIPAAQPKPAPGPVPNTVLVTGETVNIRQKGALDAPVLAKVYRGERLAVLQQQGDWYQVQLSNGLTGWVAAWLTESASGSTPFSIEYSEVLIVPIAEGKTFKVADVNGRAELNLEGWKKEEYKIGEGTNNDTLVLELDGPSTRNYEGQIARLGLNKIKIYPQNDKVVVEISYNQPIKQSLGYDGDRKITRIQLSGSQSQGLQGKLIVVDPGHAGVQPGGWLDPGAIGPRTGLYEKDVNLNVALKLKNLLEEAGARVLMTHTGQTELTLAGRAFVANNSGADIFVSIHANSANGGGKSGHSTYFYAPAGDAVLGSQRYNRQKLAALVQRELVKAAGRKDIGVLEANFAVLRETVVPSILVETAYLSDPEEELLLGQEAFRSQLAVGIFNGINAYFE